MRSTPGSSATRDSSPMRPGSRVSTMMSRPMRDRSKPRRSTNSRNSSWRLWNSRTLMFCVPRKTPLAPGNSLVAATVEAYASKSGLACPTAISMPPGRATRCRPSLRPFAVHEPALRDLHGGYAHGAEEPHLSGQQLAFVGRVQRGQHVAGRDLVADLGVQDESRGGVDDVCERSATGSQQHRRPPDALGVVLPA